MLFIIWTREAAAVSVSSSQAELFSRVTPYVLLGKPAHWEWKDLGTWLNRWQCFTDFCPIEGDPKTLYRKKGDESWCQAWFQFTSDGWSLQFYARTPLSQLQFYHDAEPGNRVVFSARFASRKYCNWCYGLNPATPSSRGWWGNAAADVAEKQQSYPGPAFSVLCLMLCTFSEIPPFAYVPDHMFTPRTHCLVKFWYQVDWLSMDWYWW